MSHKLFSDSFILQERGVQTVYLGRTTHTFRDRNGLPALVGNVQNFATGLAVHSVGIMSLQTTAMAGVGDFIGSNHGLGQSNE